MEVWTFLLSHGDVSQISILFLLFFLFILRDLPSSTENVFVKHVGGRAVCMAIYPSLHPPEMNEFLSHIEWWSVDNGLTFDLFKYQTVSLCLRHEWHLNTPLEFH